MAPDIHMSDSMHVDVMDHEPTASMTTASGRESSASSNSRAPRDSSEASQGTSTTPDSTQDSVSGPSFVGQQPGSCFQRHKPQLLETLLWHGGRNTEVNVPQVANTHSLEQHTVLSSVEAPAAQERRRFTPHLVETAQRSRRSGDNKPALTLGDKTDVIATVETVLRRKRFIHPAIPFPSTSTAISNTAITTAEARRLGIPLPKRQYSSESDLLLYSLRSPRLDTIDSSESDRSGPPSPRVSSPPAFLGHNRTKRSLDIVHNKHPGSLLAFAATNAERQLREQALAAFPNDDRHLPVHHYVDVLETPPGSTPSSAFSTRHEVEMERYYSENWELKELRAHHDRLYAEREQQRLKREARRKLQDHLVKNPWAIPLSIPEEGCMIKSIDDLDSRERPRVRPPMLGADIEFPRSDSPDPARFDVTQGAESLRKAMCYLSEQSGLSESSGGLGGLWIPKKEASITPSCAWSRPASRAPSNAGLWGGSCLDANSPPRGPTGIMTPKFDEEHSSLPKDTMSLFRQHLPPSPPPSSSGVTSLDECMENETSIEAEFNDTFITQVYNYMSLGYPAIARDFDEELSKVTGTPIQELRKDDDLPRSCGYIRLGEETAVQSGVTEANCARWKALRIYILEWARQHPNMAQPKQMESGWVGARKGSWAL